MNWPAAIVTALAMWGIGFAGQIIARDDDGNPAYAGTTAVAWADLWTEAPDCIITVMPSRMATYSDEAKQNLITHEVGHCLGLGHIQTEGVMYPDASQFSFSGYDRAEFWQHYPAPFRTIMALVAAP